MALDGPNPEPTYKEFMANVYFDVHGSLKFLADEHVILEEPLNELGKFNVDSEVVSKVIVLIHQASSSIPSISTSIINLSPPKPVSFTTQAPIFTATTTTTAATLLPPQQQSLTDSKDHFRKLPKADMKEILHQWMFESGSYKSLPEHVALYEALEASLEQASRDEFLTEKINHARDVVTIKTLLHVYNIQIQVRRENMIRVLQGQHSPQLLNPQPGKHLTLKRLLPAPLGKSHLLTEQPIKDLPITDNMEECHLLLTDQVDLANPEGHRIVPEVRKPLPLRVPPALSISKLKVAHYLDFGLEELVMSLWIESEHEYDISFTYGISYYRFKRKEFCITRHDAPSDHSKVRSHMRILSVISLKTYERYVYTFLKDIILHRADYKEYKISEADFKNLHLNDFEDLYLLHL
nr:hypothetical protein [Tanacetum cinerariifolium]